MALASSIPSNLWPETVSAATYLINRTPTKALSYKTPYEYLNGYQPVLSHLYVFGCKAYPLIQKILRSEKLLPRAHVGYLIGYDSSNIFRIWIPTKNQVIRTRDVTFDDSSYYDPKVTDLSILLNEAELHEVIQVLDNDLVRTIADNQSTDEIIILNLTIQNDISANPLPSPPPTDCTLPDTSLSSETTYQDNNIRIRHGWTYQPATEPAPRGSDISSGFDEANILPIRTRNRYQAHSLALSKIDQLSGFHSAFAIDHTSYQKLYRDDLPPEPKNWKQLLKHPYRTEFQTAA